MLKYLDSIEDLSKRIRGMGLPLSTLAALVTSSTTAALPQNGRFRRWCGQFAKDLRKEIDAESQRQREVKVRGQSEPIHENEVNVREQPEPINCGEGNIGGQPESTNESEVKVDGQTVPINESVGTVQEAPVTDEGQLVPQLDETPTGPSTLGFQEPNAAAVQDTGARDPHGSLSNSDFDPFLISLTHPWYRRVLNLRQHGERNNIIRTDESSIHNTGVFAQRYMKRNTIIAEYMGEVISAEEQQRRETVGLGGYFCTLETPDRVIDGRVTGNIGKYFNHSCEPNTILELLTFRNGDFATVITAKRKIRRGEELTYDYGCTLGGDASPCNCGSTKCHFRNT